MFLQYNFRTRALFGWCKDRAKHCRELFELRKLAHAQHFGRFSAKFAAASCADLQLDMPHCCVAIGCHSKQGACSYGFHRFPTDRARRKKWEEALNRQDWHATEYSRICGAHFVNGEYFRWKRDDSRLI